MKCNEGDDIFVFEVMQTKTPYDVRVEYVLILLLMVLSSYLIFREGDDDFNVFSVPVGPLTMWV